MTIPVDVARCAAAKAAAGTEICAADAMAPGRFRRGRCVRSGLIQWIRA